MITVLFRVDVDYIVIDYIIQKLAVLKLSSVCL